MLWQLVACQLLLNRRNSIYGVVILMLHGFSNVSKKGLFYFSPEANICNNFKP